jgi:hypothetical protein
MSNTNDTARTEVAVSNVAESRVFHQVADYLDRNEWKFVTEENQSLYSMSINGRSTTFRVLAQVSEIASVTRVVVYSVIPVRIPERRRLAVAEALVRFNYRVIQGCAEMDFKDGEVRIKTLVTAVNGEINDVVLDYALLTGIDLANRLFEPLMAIGFGNAGPDTMYEMAMEASDAVLQ